MLFLLLFALPILGYTQDEVNEDIFDIFDISAVADFPGGDSGLLQYIIHNVIYPQEALDAGGTVYVMFVVNRDSSVSDITTLGEDKGYGIDKEAMRVMRSTSGMWTPAKQGDKNVRMRLRVPIKFVNTLVADELERDKSDKLTLDPLTRVREVKPKEEEYELSDFSTKADFPRW